MANPFSKIRAGIPFEEDIVDKPEEESSETVVVEEEPSQPVEVDPTIGKIAKGFQAPLALVPYLAETFLGSGRHLVDLPKKVGITKHQYYSAEDGPVSKDPESGVSYLKNDPSTGVIKETGRLYKRVIAPKGFSFSDLAEKGFDAYRKYNFPSLKGKEFDEERQTFGSVLLDKESYGKLVKPETWGELELEEIHEPTWLPEELSKNPEWLGNARTVYKAEEGKDYKQSDAQLSRWFRRRHSKLANDMVNMGLTALDVKNMTAETKDAFVNSMDMWDDTKATIGSAGWALGYTLADPATWGTIPLAIGVNMFVKKVGLKKAREWILKLNMDDLTKKELLKKVDKEAVKQWADQGFSKEITTQTLSKAQKDAARELGKNAAKAGAFSTGAWSGAYDAEYQWLNRELGRDGWEKYSPLQTAQAVLMGATIGGPIGKQVGTKTALWGAKRKLRNHQGRLDFLEYQKNRKNLDTTDSTIPNKSTAVDIESIAADLQQHLALKGTVKLDVQGARAAIKKHLEKIGAKGDAAKNLTYEDIEDIFSRYGIELNTSGKRGQFVGKKVFEFGSGIIDPKTGRKFQERMWGKVKRSFSASSGLGRAFQSSRRRYDSNALKAERAIKKRLGGLKKAIEVDYGVTLKNITDEQFDAMDQFLRGHAVTLPRNVTNELKAMRNHINYLQERLWDSGVLKKEYDKDGNLKQDSLAFKIRNSIDGKDPELWITRQYEVFDNPDWATKIGANLEVMDRARTFLRGRLKNNKEFEAVDKKASVGRYTENGLEQYDYKKAGLTDEEIELHQAFIGKGGTLDKLMYEITHATDEEGLFQMFSNQRPLGNKPLKILERREDIPSQLRAVMGEYKEPFSNFQNSVMKLEQTIATYQYEKEIADLVRAGLLDGTGGFNEQLGRVELLRSRMPKRAGVARPLAEGLELKESGLNRPLDNMHGTNEVVEAIANGNEIWNDLNYFKPLQYYLAQQGHTRLAKTVYNTGAIARNFLSAGIMAAGAGYITPRHLKAIPKIFRGMYNMDNPVLQAHMEKGLYLGYLQSGTVLGQFRAALGEAGDPSYWKGDNPLYKGGNYVQRKAKQFNIGATKFYQLMDDTWKEFGFLSEKDMQRPVLRDMAHVAKAKRQAGEELTPQENDLLKEMDNQGGKDYDPELDIVHTFKSADGIDVNITRLDMVAADMVAKHMQNYAGVPQFVRYSRLLPAADFLAFNTELARTTKDILWSSGNDMIQGSRVVKRNIILPDGTRAGQAQRALGRRRLGSQIAAQSSAAAVGGTSTWYLASKAYDIGGDLKDWMRGEEVLDDTTDAIESFDQEWAKGNQYMWLTEPKEGQGRRLNLSFQNPYAVMQDPIRGTMRDMANGTFSEKTVQQRTYDHALKPLFNMMGPSMWAGALMNIWKNTDEYGRIIWDREQNTTRENVGNVIKELWKGYEPGSVRDAERIVSSITDRPEGKSYALKPGTMARKYTTFDSILGLIGVRPEYYDIRNNMLGELIEQRSVSGRSSQIFDKMLRSQKPMNVDELTSAYARSLDIQYRSARKMSNTIQRAKAAGLSNDAIIKYVTKDAMFIDKLDKQMIKDLVNKGRFLPPKPNVKDMRLWAKFAKDNGLQIPPTEEAEKQLFQIWRQNLGMQTGSQVEAPIHKNPFTKIRASQ